MKINTPHHEKNEAFYYDRKKGVLWFIAYLVISPLIFLLMYGHGYLSVMGFLAYVLYALMISYVKIFDTSPQLIITKNEIWSKKYGQYYWDDIFDIEVYNSLFVNRRDNSKFPGQWFVFKVKSKVMPGMMSRSIRISEYCDYKKIIESISDYHINPYKKFFP